MHFSSKEEILVYADQNYRMFKVCEKRAQDVLVRAAKKAIDRSDSVIRWLSSSYASLQASIVGIRLARFQMWKEEKFWAVSILNKLCRKLKDRLSMLELNMELAFG